MQQTSVHYPLPSALHCDATSLTSRPLSLTSYFHMPPWCNISPKTYLQPQNPSVLHRWCNTYTCQPLPSACHCDAISLALKPWCVASMMQQTLLANLFLLQATVLVMQHFSLRNHGVLNQQCNTPLPLTLSSCRHSDATSLSAHKLGLFLWSGGALQHWCNKL